MLGPILRGEKISLEPAKPSDLPVFVRWFADTGVTRYLLARFVPSESQEADMHRVLEKSGYRNIARRRNVYWRAGRWHDDFLFELLRDDWRQATV
jgi:hypothetical protein